jgi:gamma-glutamyltranspeptidase
VGPGARRRTVVASPASEHDVQHTRSFPRGVVATPHHLASAAGLAILRAGGNAVDAAVAANAVLGVVTPYYCGPGGDLFAIVVEPDGEVHALESAGRTPASMTLQSVLSALPKPAPGRVPEVGALAVTVPGAVAGWATLQARHGRFELGRVLEDAIAYARDGVPVSAHAAGAFDRSRLRFAGQASWQAAFGHVRAGGQLIQPAHAAFLTTIANDGPDALYGGSLGEQLAAFLQAEGSMMTVGDLAAHQVLDVTPLTTMYGDLEVLELPPPTQGVTALQALGVADRLRLADADAWDADEVLRTHLQIEAVRGALVDRDQHVTDPDRMAFEAAELVTPARLDSLASAVDRERAGTWPPATPAPGGTAYLCAADDEGRTVSLIQSNFMGFGSGLVAPFGVTLQNRGAQLSLDPNHINVVAPSVRTLHTLIPAVARRGDKVVLTFGTMGGDGQPQTHLQLLDRLRRGVALQQAHAEWRFVVQPSDGLVIVEGRCPDAVVEGLRHRGHELHQLRDWDGMFGHAHAIARTEHGWEAASDPRAEGAAAGW